MFRKLICEKKNLIAYFLTFFISLGVLASGSSPFNIAFLGGLVERKIPILIPFILVLRSNIF